VRKKKENAGPLKRDKRDGKISLKKKEISSYYLERDKMEQSVLQQAGSNTTHSGGGSEGRERNRSIKLILR